MPPRTGIFLAVALSSLIALPAAAQDTTAQASSPVVSPEELVRRGAAEREAGRDAEALALFEQAYAAGRSPVALAQIAVTEQALGRWIAAEAHMRAALAIEDHPYIQRIRATLEAAYAIVRRHVGSLDVRVDAPDATLWIDGEPVGPARRADPLRLLVGAHRLEVRADGYYTVSRPIEVVPDTLAREEATLRRIEPPTTPARAEREGDDRSVTPARSTAPVVATERGPRALTWALWGGSVVALTVGAIGHGFREATAARYNAQCMGGDDPSAPCVGLRADGGALLGVAITGYVLGAALAIGGAADAVIARPVFVTVTAGRAQATLAIGGVL
jgi:hypothetical protein